MPAVLSYKKNPGDTICRILSDFGNNLEKNY